MIGQFLQHLWGQRPTPPIPSENVMRSLWWPDGTSRRRHRQHADAPPLLETDLTSTEMRLTLLGPPAAGKGTQAARLAERLAVPKLSSEDALRTAVSKSTPFGCAAREAADLGRPVGDEILTGCLLERVAEPDAAGGFVFDDFPRALRQAQALDADLKRSGAKLDAVLELKVGEAALLDRAIHRARLAKAMGMPTRTDDDLECFKTLLDDYRVRTEPLFDYYRSIGLLITVNGLLPIDEVATQLMGKLRK